MGMSLSAKLMFGYPMPEIDYDNRPAWYTESSGVDLDAAWDHTFLPDEIKALDLSPEQHAAWNAIPYPPWNSGVRREHTPEYKALSDAYGMYLDARREWLQENPLPAVLEYAGHGDGELQYFLVPLVDGKPLMTEADYHAEPIDLKALMAKVDEDVAWAAQNTLDTFLTSIGIDPAEAKAGWHLAPLYW